ncbi:FHA domain-containing protein [Altererythrobacter aurantiacus]|uniref:FHA domain-containing protein n=1 Tax=Parapontixanthobacter aurantiacus TaxID=1463599 RepID=A0A844ZFB4_9SPHN|nr:type VI secretion system-associated FHA domain protein [Parapontixanthobacter aurantiacus]MXO85993.1 FHA domain-containing protein [Parapontixanthobacter aurantiacus]
MYMLQLFHADDAAQPIDARLLASGNLSIGRDAKADWNIPDPDCEVSRYHCQLCVTEEGVSLFVTGSNGVFDDYGGTRYPEEEELLLSLPASLRLGSFLIIVAPAPLANSPNASGDRTMVLTPPLGQSLSVPSEWEEPLAPSAPGSGTLLEAFCEGAQLDPSLLSSEDPSEIMRRAGGLYRQMVLGIGDLMAERDTARQRYQINRTTISCENNNPFKWAPSQRLAIDLLLAETTGFMSGPAALRSSFRDVKLHLMATFAGLQGSLRAAIEHLNPNSLDGSDNCRKRFFATRSSAILAELCKRHASLRLEIDEGRSGELDRAFVLAYDDAGDAAVAEQCD